MWGYINKKADIGERLQRKETVHPNNPCAYGVPTTAPCMLQRAKPNGIKNIELYCGKGHGNLLATLLLMSTE